MGIAQRQERHRKIHPSARIGRVVALLSRQFHIKRRNIVSTTTPLSSRRNPASNRQLPECRTYRQPRPSDGIGTGRIRPSDRRLGYLKGMALPPVRRRTTAAQPCPRIAAQTANPVPRRSHQPAQRRIRIDADANPQTRTARYAGHQHQPSKRNQKPV